MLIKLSIALALSMLVSGAIASSDPPCEAHDQLRAQRDNALRTKNFKQYCDALSGLIKLMPEKPPAQARLKCEAKATKVNVETWLGIRPTVVSTMKETFDQQCG